MNINSSSQHGAVSEFLRSPVNWLFAFIFITLALEHSGKVSAPTIFFSAALAIIPIAALIVQATEQIASRTGDAVGGCSTRLSVTRRS